MEVSYGITSKLRVLDGDLDRVAVKLQRLGMLGRDAGAAINKGLTTALRGPGGALAAIGEVEKRLQNLGRRQAGGSFLDRTIWRIKEMEDRGRRGAQGIDAARMRLATGRADDNLAHLRGLAGGGEGGSGGGALGMMLSQAGGMALYNGLVGAVKMTTDALMATASTFHRVNREAETAVMGLQSVYMSGMGLDAGQARGMARRTFGSLARAAATGPAETIDYVSAYQRLFTTLRQAGASSKEIEKLTIQSVGAGDMDMPGRGRFLGPMDIYQSMTSGLRPDITPYTVRALGNIGVSPEKFRESSQRQKIDTLLKAYDTYSGAIIEYGKTVAAQEDTFSDNMKRMVRAISPEPFEAYRVGLLESNRIMDGLNAENSTVRDGLHKTTGALTAIAVDVSRGFNDELLRSLPPVGNALTALATDLGILRDSSVSLSEAFGASVATFGVNLTKFAIASARVPMQAIENLKSGYHTPLSAIKAAIYYVANSPQLPGLNEEGIPLSLLQPGTGSDDGIPDMLRKPESLGGAIGAAAGRELGKGRSPVKLDVNIEWGSDRSLAIAFQSVADQVARQLTRMPLGSSQVGAFQSFG